METACSKSAHWTLFGRSTHSLRRGTWCGWWAQPCSCLLVCSLDPSVISAIEVLTASVPTPSIVSGRRWDHDRFLCDPSVPAPFVLHLLRSAVGHEHASCRLASRSAARLRAVVPVEIVRFSFKTIYQLSHIEGPRRAISNHSSKQRVARSQKLPPARRGRRRRTRRRPSTLTEVVSQRLRCRSSPRCGARQPIRRPESFSPRVPSRSPNVQR